MPNWKKLITSGSDATLNSLNVSTAVTASSYTGSFVGDGSGLTGLSTAAITSTANGANNRIATYTDSNTLEGDANFTWDGSKIFLANGKHIQFTDQEGTFPTNKDSKFKWLLNNDSYEHFAFQPASDQIDVNFKITDNVGSTDRFVFWIDDYRGETFDAYPLYMDGNNFVVNYQQKYNSGTAYSNNVDFYIAASGSTAHTTNPVLKADVSLNRVGIGTNAPDELFDVAGTARFQTGIAEGTVYVGDNIQHWGDGGTGVYFDTDEVQIKTDGGTTRATIDAAGLDVVGAITASGDISASGDITLDTNLKFGASTSTITTANSSGNILINPDGTLKLGESGTDNIYIGRQDNVSYTTRIYGGNSTENIKTGLNYVQLNVPVTASGDISASGDVNANSYLLQGETIADYDGVSKYRIGTLAAGRVNHYRGSSHFDGAVTASGNISASGDFIGVTGSFDYVKTSKLQVGSSGGTDILSIDGGDLQLENGRQITFADIGDGNTGRVKIAGNEDTDILSLHVDNSNTKNLTLTTTGVGIGTISPGEKLEVVGNISASGDMFASSFIADKSFLVGELGQNGAILISGSSTNGDERNSQIISQRSLEFRSTGGSTDNILKLEHNGNVGIGVEAPTAKLHVDGDAIITGTLTAQEYHTEFVSASIMFSSGSTKFGDTPDDNHEFTGSLSVTGTVSGHLLPHVPKVEHYIVSSSTLVTDTVMDLPNSLSFVTSSDGYEYLEIFADGMRLSRTIDYTEIDTNTVRYLVAIPSQSVITYKSIKTV